jgi:hypothetical protein
MAIQLQIRRGTTAENDVFTGAVGELTMDTDTNGVRVHDGTTTGGVKIPTEATADYVVEWQMPTDLNGYTWYRKYKSGWVEQGGAKDGVANNTNLVITFPIPMANNKYTIVLGQELLTSDTYSARHAVIQYETKKTTGVSIRNARFSGETTPAMAIDWQVSGMSAQ